MFKSHQESPEGMRDAADCGLSPTALPISESVTLTPTQRDRLQQGLCAVPSAQAGSDFNAVVLASLQNRPGLKSWSGYVMARLRLAVLPALLGFILMYGISWAVGRRLAIIAAAPLPVIAEQPVPLLPALPAAPPALRTPDRTFSNVNTGGTTYVR